MRWKSVLVGVFAAAVLLGPSGSNGQGVDLEQAATLLRSQSVQDVRTGIELLGVSQDRRAARFLAEYVRQGPPGAVIETVAESLAALGGPDTLEPLLSLTRHRRPGVRARAAEALVGIQSPQVRPVLERMLADSDPTVRGAAARGLAQAGTAASVGPLFRAFDRGLAEASLAIGEIGSPADADRLLEALGRRPLPEILPGLQAFMDRRNVPDAVKVRIIHRLQELATVEVRMFLEEWLAGQPRRGGAVREAAEEAIQRIAE